MALPPLRASAFPRSPHAALYIYTQPPLSLLRSVLVASPTVPLSLTDRKRGGGSSRMNHTLLLQLLLFSRALTCTHSGIIPCSKGTWATYIKEWPTPLSFYVP
ncbi:hypothetical protein GDO81_026899 [Engystomops pustulosus]|uniref:Uncharacterized protein n=1 Tax=Engystomops pustulosus TaxID=76066 RepID=A0AAV6YLX3_ENGPU|nr:hypothetical protein GDO81_026899 [Engystomops pustulosus]